MYISNTGEINKLQTDIMLFISLWVRTYKTKVPQKEIIAAMKEKGIKDFTVMNAINKLLRLHYIKKSEGYESRFTEYIQLRTV